MPSAKSFVTWAILTAFGVAGGARCALSAEPTALRRLSSKHLMLVTDLPSSVQIDSLPEAFDAAVPQWAAYFGVEERATADWRVEACLMGERKRFEAAGTLPPNLPDFSHGYSRGDRLWAFDQPSDYYRRHLLFHEGTHCFMTRFLGGVGPPWFFEGMAELLATHRTEIGAGEPRHALNYFPNRREEVPMLGRIKIVQDAVRAGRPLALAAVTQTPFSAFQRNEPYAWCWSVVALLDHHPRYQRRFRQLFSRLGEAPSDEGAFRQWIQSEFGDEWPLAVEEWQILVHEMEHGYDFSRTAVEYEAPLRQPGDRVRVAVDRGWQSTGIRLEAGQEYRCTAAGRYQVAAGDGKPWLSEPGGVTVRYHHGRPLGQLLGAVRPNAVDGRSDSPLVRPLTLGASAELRPEAAGTLYLRINESAADLADNQGQVEVVVEPTVEPSP